MFGLLFCLTASEALLAEDDYYNETDDWFGDDLALSGGAIAGIAVGCVVGVVLLIAFIVYADKKRVNEHLQDAGVAAKERKRKGKAKGKKGKKRAKEESSMSLSDI